MEHLYRVDPEIGDAILNEAERENSKLELIASENFVSRAVLETMGSVMTNKYAEGYPGRRYYGGCEWVDVAENLAIERAKKLFNAEHANVQPLSGVPANLAVYNAFLQPGEKFFGLALSHGGHLSHGYKVSATGKLYNAIQYTVDPKTEQINYDALWKLAKEEKPKLIMTGASAYPRILHWDKFRAIADDVGAYFIADIAHIAGLVVAGLHPNPVPLADAVTTTTHKTLRGPRGAIILCKEQYKKAIDKSVFPSLQGGPHMHIIAAKAVAFKEAMSDDFKNYQKQIVKNAKAFEEEFKRLGWRLVAGGTDTHLLLIDVKSKGITGKAAEEALDQANITVNKNTIPFDKEKPFIASGIRIGTPALTTRGMKEEEMKKIAKLIDRVLTHIENKDVYEEVKGNVKELTEAFPLYVEYRNELKSKRRKNA
ncbi:serine hydroxymethyltransferase [candidate division WOR-3 bacterium]|nr:serine hydroxymethyltransferase [candidate division WOR-3 bacterium]